MAVYAIGDVQGCYDQLRALLDRLGFDPQRDRLWLAGDLVNRGPSSLQTLRFIKGLGQHAIAVLGNHDLHALAVAAGCAPQRRSDHLDDVLSAPDRDELLDWLRARPLLHHDARLGYTLIHAGLPPQWDLQTAQRCAAQVEEMLRGPRYREFFEHMYGNQPDRWSETLRGWDRLRFIVNCFTRLRYCDDDGVLHLGSSGPPGTQPAPFQPWFAARRRASADLRIVFGHWSTLTLEPHEHENVYPLDTGCLWGRSLTAMRLDGPPVRTHVDCPKGLARQAH